MTSGELEAEVVWASTDESIASVSAGLVSAVGTGTATITAAVDGVGTASCQVTVVDPEVAPVEPVEPEAAPLQPAEFAIQDAGGDQPLVFAAGEGIPFVITMRNPTGEPLVLECDWAQIYDIRVLDSNETLVWNWALRQDFTAGDVSELVLPAGEERTYPETWDQKDNEGFQVPAGAYEVYLDLVCPGWGMPDQTAVGPLAIEITA